MFGRVKLKKGPMWDGKKGKQRRLKIYKERKMYKKQIKELNVIESKVQKLIDMVYENKRGEEFQNQAKFQIATKLEECISEIHRRERLIIEEGP